MMALTREQIESCVTPGVTERPPVPDQTYAGFVVHPRKPGPLVLAIGHRHGEQFILDLCRDGLTVQQAADLLKAYRIDTDTGADDESADSVSLAHAVCGVISVLKEATP
jgi:hypothetical protein